MKENEKSKNMREAKMKKEIAVIAAKVAAKEKAKEESERKKLAAFAATFAAEAKVRAAAARKAAELKKKRAIEAAERKKKKAIAAAKRAKVIQKEELVKAKKEAIEMAIRMKENIADAKKNKYCLNCVGFLGPCVKFNGTSPTSMCTCYTRCGMCPAGYKDCFPDDFTGSSYRFHQVRR
jgi:hypothetical protein